MKKVKCPICGAGCIDDITSPIDYIRNSFCSAVCMNKAGNFIFDTLMSMDKDELNKLDKRIRTMPPKRGFSQN